MVGKLDQSAPSMVVVAAAFSERVISRSVPSLTHFHSRLTKCHDVSTRVRLRGSRCGRTTSDKVGSTLLTDSQRRYSAALYQLPPPDVVVVFMPCRTRSTCDARVLLAADKDIGIHVAKIKRTFLF